MLYKLKRIAFVVAVISVTSCGGGGGDNYIIGGADVVNSDSSGGAGNTDTTDDTTTTGDARIADLEIAVSSRQLASDGSDPVIISAVVKDAKNNILKDVDVEFAVDNGGTIEPDEGNSSSVDNGGPVTGGNAVKTAKLTPGFNNENRNLVVTVTAGSQKSTIDVVVAGTRLDLNGPGSVGINMAGSYVVTLFDSGGKPLAYKSVSVASSQGNTISPATDKGFTTDQNGQLAFEFKALNSGVDTLAISSLGATVNHDVMVSDANFGMTSSNVEIDVNSTEVVNLVWLQGGVPQANKKIGLSATRGVVPSSVVTDANGRASFTLSSGTAGGSVVTAVANHSGLSTTLVREFVAVEPTQLAAQAEQYNISSEGQTILTAIVRDANYNPVKNQTVNFSIVNDTVGGLLSSGAAVTDSLGRANVTYTAGNASSARDGVKIQVYLEQNTEIKSSILLSVGDRAVQIVLGHDENISEQGVFYHKAFGVIVTDSAGNPVANKTVSFTLMPIGYFKGLMVCVPDQSPDWQQEVTAFCPSEDTNDNAILDVDLKEDYNNNGILDPTHPATIISRSVTTDKEGKAVVEMAYPQSEAGWSQMLLRASASVGGTEYATSLKFALSALADDLKNCTSKAPPNPISPYGIDNKCESPD